ncbi:MAG: UDP-N-acetylglucosamine--N-acetylmuramyl-(pentapeptide) pyrophosphoryl-undecaprenol N-acetylglucosamine transferase [Acidimicrobiales bacterium]|nr:MAG: undecaprenyldiphospho-muramoylpentapeptide beta-N-acetylglucosaminyltransferase [Actinomycetota bacterium]MBV6508751.1 UDP-N-acetylglucosamine--N-acetylmuramyl-(pentapeptide) pyrophosphoryl-undecaprenol N-acetylglucosamine transferase [Acidimicrobiales bacterium]RIK06512.1 MAG: undecaprenyldiphospho-muramoylpentapeptide beta-N-acetylglucosaminyltransferase [Acidobacteriota bacterium]
MNHPIVVIAGGGTAGHILPGVAVAKALVDRGVPSGAIHFIGSERGLEADLVPAAGFELTLLPGRGIQRRLTLKNLSAAWGLGRALFGALRLLHRHRPEVLLTVGGYASVACVVSAVLLRIPIVVCEQNARAGLANRLAARFAVASAVPFAQTDLPRAVVTGNPVRAEVLAVADKRDRPAARRALGLPAERTVIAVFSGSLGARRLNEAVREAAGTWVDRGDLAIRHVVGARDFDAFEIPVRSRTCKLLYQAIRYEERMDLLLAAADLVICRSGGTTVAELACVGLPSVLVPLPTAPRDHQTANAMPLVDAGASVLIADDELDADRLRLEVEAIVDVPGRMADMAAAARSLGRPEAAERVADLVEERVDG